MDKKSVVIYTMEYYSAIKKNTFESVLMRWMKFEPIIQSEVSQKEKQQYSILTHPLPRMSSHREPTGTGASWQYLPTEVLLLVT